MDLFGVKNRWIFIYEFYRICKIFVAKLLFSFKLHCFHCFITNVQSFQCGRGFWCYKINEVFIKNIERSAIFARSWFRSMLFICYVDLNAFPNWLFHELCSFSGEIRSILLEMPSNRTLVILPKLHTFISHVTGMLKIEKDVSRRNVTLAMPRMHCHSPRWRAN